MQIATSSTNILGTVAACACCYVFGAVYANGWLLAYGQGTIWLLRRALVISNLESSRD